MALTRHKDYSYTDDGVKSDERQKLWEALALLQHLGHARRLDKGTRAVCREAYNALNWAFDLIGRPDNGDRDD